MATDVHRIPKRWQQPSPVITTALPYTAPTPTPNPTNSNTNGRTNNNTYKRRWQPKSSGYPRMPSCRPYLASDLSAIPIPSSRTVGRTAERMKWQQYPSALSHLDTSACEILCHSFQVICQQMHMKLWRIDGRAYGRTEGTRVIPITKMWSAINIQKYF